MGVVLRGSWCAGGVAAAGSDASAGAGLARGVALGHEGQDRNGACHQGENRAAQRPGGAQGEVASSQEEDEVQPPVQGAEDGDRPLDAGEVLRSEEHTSELQSRQYLVCRLLLEKKKPTTTLPSNRRSGRKSGSAIRSNGLRSISKATTWLPSRSATYSRRMMLLGSMLPVLAHVT